METQLSEDLSPPLPPAGPPLGDRQIDLLIRIDRYLRAAGVDNSRQRSRLIAATVSALRAEPSDAGDESETWAEIIAAVDLCLADEFATVPAAERRTVPAAARLPGVAGRIALHHRVAPAAWGTPPRQPLTMSAQDFTFWRPGLGWLARLAPQPAKGHIAASLCCLAVLFIS